jgi:hypothetical protein
MLQRPPLLCLALAYGLLHATAKAHANDAPSEQNAPMPSCIEVEVDGEKAPSYACLSQRLSPAAPAARPSDQGLASESITQRPGNQLGVFNRAATSNRMGNTFGNSVYPQRPPPTAPAPLVMPRSP